MPDHIYRSTIVTPSGEIATTRTYTATGHASVAESIANGQTALQINIAIDVSALKSLVIKSDQTVTIKTNSSGSPDDTLVIEAGVEYSWNEDSLDACQLGTDVTTIFVANASGAAAALVIDAIQDATP